MLIAWLLILTINMTGQEITVGKYVNEGLCKSIATQQIKNFGSYSLFRSYRCDRSVV
jgi:hypothetical protein